jgi:uncharacterized protein YqgC (DUF456 family)
MSGTVVVCGLLVVVGLFGIVVPVVPGTILVALGIGIWASEQGSVTSWTVFGVAAAFLVSGALLKYAVPGRRLKRTVPTSTLVVAGLCAVVGFFVIPVVGAVVGFVLGIFVVELGRSRDGSQAWTRTKHALVGVLHSMGIELAAGLVVTALYVAGVLVS